MITKFLNSQTKSVSFATAILAGSYFFSATLGLLREHLLASRFGAGNELDVYYAAFTIPDFIAFIFILGAISAAIIPIFSSYLAKSEQEAWQYVLALLSTFLLVLIGVCIVLIIAAPFLVSFIAPGFSGEKKEMTILIMRIMFLSPIILGASNIISGILQVYRKFFITALAPLFYNMGIILGIIFLAPFFGLSGLALGVVLGGLLHLSIQIPSFFHSGFRIKSMALKTWNFSHPGVLRTLRLMVPRSLGLGAGQFNAIVITAVASTLASGSVAVFNLANNLSSMLVNAVAVSLSTAVFPAMTLSYSKDNKDDFKKKFSVAFRQIIFLMLPASLLLFILRAQVVRVVLGSGKFGWIDTRLTAACLGVFSLSLCAQGLIFLFSKTFYAIHNTKIPAIVSVATVAFNIAMSLWLVNLLSVRGFFFYFLQSWLKLEGLGNIAIAGLAFAYAITAIAEASLLLVLIYNKAKVFKIREIFNSFYNIIIASAFMCIVAILVRQGLVWYDLVNLRTFWGVLFQLAAAGFAGVAVYIAVSLFLRSEEIAIIMSLFFKNNRSTDFSGKTFN